ncbi:carcinoembryonic antigen-related cell adhesion molecule 5-like [Monodelphis domestica]|uniref:carcinoembryonic antigen-related cell adhesion molecule 5-like n=1 Tax=Monodelphis domestica TaxID=13616 RepID=UPI0024E1BDF7|nr:carcinoembryonic antigen-related cell adhesion molecule 5-like [Monodelphis domestica]
MNQEECLVSLSLLDIPQRLFWDTHLWPLLKPTINSPNRIPVENVDSVSLTCNATGQIDTYRQNSLGCTREKKLSHSAKLSIPNVSLKHAGTYICHASNSYTGLNNTKDKNLTIYVEEKKFAISEENKNFIVNAEFTMYENLMKPNKINRTSFVIENGTAVLTCNTEDEHLPDIWWYYKNKRLILNDRMTLSDYDQTLTIMPAKREDSGAYHCEMWDPFLVHTSDSFNLVVCYGPEKIKILPSSVNGQIEVTFNENLTLGCQANSQPLAHYTWQVNGSSISGNSRKTYTISQASWENAGAYTCIATNEVANTTISTKITVRVIADKSHSLYGKSIKGIVIGSIVGVTLMGTLISIYRQFFREPSQ